MRRLIAPLAAAVVADRLGRRRTQGAVVNAVQALTASQKAPSEQREDAVVALLRDRPQAPGPSPATPITDRIHARLLDGDAALVEARLEGGRAELFAACDASARRRLTLNFAVAYGVLAVTERAGLAHAMPPDDVHAMARGAAVAGGDFYIADLIFDALDHAGMQVAPGATVLDFGSSSGRVLRAVAAGRPDLECVGCDPNEAAIAWAAAELTMARFFASPQRPPLRLDAGSVELAYAVSIWSHFAEEPALAWLAEMHRVLAPGGALVLTTHAFDSLSTLLRRGDVSHETAAAAATAMVQGRHHFVDVFGPDGDWGVKDTGWGNAYLTLEWLLSRTGDDWAVRLNWPGALDETQDVVVLERR